LSGTVEATGWQNLKVCGFVSPTGIEIISFRKPVTEGRP
jgi:hypothetical protein